MRNWIVHLGAERTVFGELAPTLRFRLVETNQEKRLGDYKGKVVILNLWPTWCPPCLEELPELNRLQEKYRSDGLVVVTISDERREPLQRFECKGTSPNRKRILASGSIVARSVRKGPIISSHEFYNRPGRSHSKLVAGSRRLFAVRTGRDAVPLIVFNN